jgi:hypothetical protein
MVHGHAKYLLISLIFISSYGDVAVCPSVEDFIKIWGCEMAGSTRTP